MRNSNKEELDKEIKSLVSKVIKIPEAKIDANAGLYAEFGVDSLLGVEILAALDKKYEINVPEEKIKSINTLNDIINLVRELLSKRP